MCAWANLQATVLRSLTWSLSTTGPTSGTSLSLNPSLLISLHTSWNQNTLQTSNLPQAYRPGVSKQWPTGQIWSTACLWILSFIETCPSAYSYFHAAMAELSSCNREHMALQSLQYYLDHYGKSVLTSAIQTVSLNSGNSTDDIKTPSLHGPVDTIQHLDGLQTPTDIGHKENPNPKNPEPP